jgi:hypothetical protein
MAKSRSMDIADTHSYRSHNIERVDLAQYGEVVGSD